MKKLKYLISLLLIIAGPAIFHSCDELIDKKPLGDTEVSFFTTEDAFDRGIQGIYAKLTYFYAFNANNPKHQVWLLPGDDLTTRGDYDFETFAALQPSNGDLNFVYQTCYQIVNRANTMLEKIAEVEEGIYVEENLKSIHRGEALFLRALAYFRLWNFFGTSPLVKERIRGLGEQTQPSSSSGTELLDQAVSDLQEAAGLLPTTWEDKFIGRITSDAANGLLGKALVFRACYGGGNEDYTAAISAFNTISNNVSLTPHFGLNFDAFDENNEESLFEFQASNAPGFNNIWLNNDFNQSIGAMEAYWGFFNDTWSFWAHTPFVPTDKLINMYDPEDPRIAEVFKPTDKSNFQPGGYEFIKYTKRDKQGDVTSSLNNARILRYADVLLLRAEAYLQTGNNPAALADVNAIRERARNSVEEGAEPSAVPADLTSVSMQDIMDERMRELCGEEGHRFFDLKRWHAAGFINLGNWSAEDWGPSIREDFDFSTWFSETQEKMLYPIPTNETDLNPNVVQNPGY